MPTGEPVSAEVERRLKRPNRQALPVSALSDADLAAISAAEVPPEYGHLDAELPE